MSASLPPFWRSRHDRLVSVSLPALRDGLAAHGAFDAFARLRPGAEPRDRQGWWFTDSDVYKWVEAASLAGRLDLVDPVVDDITTAQQPDGYVSTWFVGERAAQRYTWLGRSHELYCTGHLLEAAVAHHRASGDERLLGVALRAADHLVAEFGPGGRDATDGHPEVELALVLLARHVGDRRYAELARTLLRRVDLDRLDELWGHAVRVLYFATGCQLAGQELGDDQLLAVADRLWASLVTTRLYVTGGVGGRWLGEMTGKAYELPNAMAYAETCAAVALVRWAVLRGEHDVASLALHNAALAGMGEDGTTWAYSNPLASDGRGEHDPWLDPHDFGTASLQERFPARRSGWFDVTCCPTNACRLLAWLPELLPPAVLARADELAAVAPVQTLVADPHVEAAGGRVAFTAGPFVFCAEGVDNPGVDLATVVVRPPGVLTWDPHVLGGSPVVRVAGEQPAPATSLYRPLEDEGPGRPVTLTLVPYGRWGNRGVGPMAVWLRR